MAPLQPRGPQNAWGVAAELPLPGGGQEQLAGAQRGHFVFRTGHRIGHGQKKWGWGIPEPLTLVHPRGEPCTSIPAPRGLVCRQPVISSPSRHRQSRRPHLLVSRSSPDGPASSHPRLPINSAALCREHGDLSPMPESPPPALLPRVGFDGSSPRVISNSPGARRWYRPSHRLFGRRSQSQHQDGRWDAGGDGMRGAMGCRGRWYAGPCPAQHPKPVTPMLSQSEKGGACLGEGYPPQETGRGVLGCSCSRKGVRWAETRWVLRRSGGCLSSAGGVFGSCGELLHQG